MSRLFLAAIALCIILVALTRVDYGFYSPPLGVASAGRDDVTADPHARELLTLKVTAADVARFHGTPSLESLSRFYGTDDSLPCSVRHTFKSDDVRGLKLRPLTAGTSITLCLN